MPPGASSGVLAPPPAKPEPAAARAAAAQPARAAAPAAPPSTAAVVPAVPMVPAGQVALMVNARFGREPPNIAGGLHWRIYPDKPDASGVFRMLREERAAAPIFVLPPGGYVVHVSFGLATAAKKVQLRSETVRETFELTAGGARFEGRVGDSRIPPGQVTFDVFRGSQLGPFPFPPYVCGTLRFRTDRSEGLRMTSKQRKKMRNRVYGGVRHVRLRKDWLRPSLLAGSGARGAVR